jgi:hypothetical protein
MGLNWSEGLKAAGKGLGQMAGMKMQEADWKYKEMAQQNRQRFQAQEAETQREFLSAENKTKRDWETPFKEEGLDIQREGQALRLEELKLQGLRYETSERQTDERIDIERTRAETAQQAQVARNADQRMKEYESDMKLLQERIDVLQEKTSGILVDKEDPAYQKDVTELQQLQVERDSITQQYKWDTDVVKLGAEKEAAYDEARAFLGERSEKAHDLSMKWAKMTEEQKAKVPELGEELLKTHPNPNSPAAKKQAYGAAIDQVYGGSSKLTNPQSKSNQVKPIEEAAVEKKKMPEVSERGKAAFNAFQNYKAPEKEPDQLAQREFISESMRG